MVLSIIFLEDKHKMLLHLSIFYEYQQFFQQRICFSIQPPDSSDPWPTLTHSTSFFLIMLFNKIIYTIQLNMPTFSWLFRPQKFKWSCNILINFFSLHFVRLYSLHVKIQRKETRLGILVVRYSILLYFYFIVCLSGLWLCGSCNLNSLMPFLNIKKVKI